MPNARIADAARMLKAMLSQEDARVISAKAADVVKRLREMKRKSVVDLFDPRVTETLAYYGYPTNHWGQIRTNNPMERVIRQRTRVVGTFPDGHSTLMLVAARRTHIGSTRWGRQRCMLMDALLNPANQEAAASERTFCPAFGRLDRAAAPPRHASSRWNEITDERGTRHSGRQESAKDPMHCQ